MPPADQVVHGGDGLDELDKRRQRRRPLPPRNPRVPPPPPALAPAVVGETRERAREGPKPEASVDVEPAESERTNAVAEGQGAPSPRPGKAVEPVQEAQPLRLAQFYITSDIDKYLRAVRAEALTQDVDVTASAVARMALQRLADEMTPQELVSELGGPKKRKGRGRPRR